VGEESGKVDARLQILSSVRATIPVREMTARGELPVRNRGHLPPANIVDEKAHLAWLRHIESEPGATDGFHVLDFETARYLVALNDPTPVLQAARAAGVPAVILGEAGGDAILIERTLDLLLADLRTAHEGWMPAFMGD